MAKGKKVGYTGEELFDADFKKRQCEINDTIVNWSSSESFQLKVREQISSSLSNHALLVDLSKRLFENGVFTDSLKNLAKKEIELSTQKTWITRLKTFFWLVCASVLTLIGEFLLRKFF